jgi:hypothetical protein
VVEQQDAWLIGLDSNPVAADAQFAGFDASGGAVLGGYTIHQAQGRDQQLVTWFGPAYALDEQGALGTAYLSNLLETVNQSGNIGPGSSGSGFFNSKNHLVGALALGRQSTDPSGYGACPVAPAAAPNGSNGVADFTSLAAVWNSTADTTSSTARATLQSVLDPGGTGSRVVPGKPVELVSLDAPPPAPRITFSPATVAAGQTFTAAWSATNAANCTLTGGIPGGTWGGSAQSFAPTGSTTESGPSGTYTFGLICQGTEPGSSPVSTQATLAIAPQADSLTANPPAEQAAENGGSNSGGGGEMGILEGVILAALLGFGLLRRTQGGRRWRMFGQLSPVRRRIREQERPTRGL